MSEVQAQEIVDLQIRVAFQEESLQTMGEQMAELTFALQLASKQIQLLSDKIKNGTGGVEEGNEMSSDDRPPHY